MIREAMLWSPGEGGKVECRLCAHRCIISPGKQGICGVRENRDGGLRTLVYGEVVAAHVDPIEKKPLYHFFPGSKALSVATAGCNFRCGFCQNWQISQAPRRKGGGLTGEPFAPEDIVRAALDQGCRSISYTYTEPTIFFEYAFDTAKLAREAGLANNFVTNGYMTAEALESIRPYLDAANVDLKAFEDETYKKVCGARLEPVLETIRRMRALGVWVEVTTLVVPGLNDGEGELAAMARFQRARLILDLVRTTLEVKTMNPLLLIPGIGMMAIALGTVIYWKAHSKVALSFFLWGAAAWIVGVALKLIAAIPTSAIITGSRELLPRYLSEPVLWL